MQPGSKYNLLTILEYPIRTGLKGYRICALVQCACNSAPKLVRKEAIISNVTKSCGCLNVQGRRKEKGHSGAWNLYLSYQENARRRNRLFDLSFVDFKQIIVNNCIYCGKSSDKLHYGQGLRNQEAIEWSAFRYTGIDRVNNDLGYSIDNCVSCCTTCNNSKRQSSVNEFLERTGKLCCKYNQGRDISDWANECKKFADNKTDSRVKLKD